MIDRKGEKSRTNSIFFYFFFYVQWITHTNQSETMGICKKGTSPFRSVKSCKRGPSAIPIYT